MRHGDEALGQLFDRFGVGCLARPDLGQLPGGRTHERERHLAVGLAGVIPIPGLSGTADHDSSGYGCRAGSAASAADRHSSRMYAIRSEVDMSTASLSNGLRSGSGALAAAAVWAVLDALVHVAVDEVEPLRIAGNATVLVALGLSWAALRWRGGPKAAAGVCAVAAVVVLGFNVAWVATEGELPIPAAVFISVCVGLLMWAAQRFRLEIDTTASGQTGRRTTGTAR